MSVDAGFVAVLAVSSAGVLVRSAEGADPLAIALWRTTIVATLLLPAARRVSTWRGSASSTATSRDGGITPTNRPA